MGSVGILLLVAVLAANKSATIALAQPSLEQVMLVREITPVLHTSIS